MSSATDTFATRPIYGTDGSVTLYVEGDTFGVAVDLPSADVAAAFGGLTFPQACERYCHPFADDAIPDPFGRPYSGAGSGVVALAESIAAEHPAEDEAETETP